jgi:integrase
MPRKPTGQLYENRSKRTGKVTSYGVRFRYAGKRRYVTLDATTEQEAEVALAHLMADVQRGLWTPPEDQEPEPERRVIPTFYGFASEWLAGQRTEGGRDGRGLSRRGDVDLCWRLNKHLLPFFARLRLDEITVEGVDRYRREKVAEGVLSPGSVNKMLTTLGSILEVAVEYDLITRNPAKGKRRRLRVSRPRRSYLDRAEHIDALLEAARWLIPRDSWMRGVRWVDAGRRTASKPMLVASARRRVAPSAAQRAPRAARTWNQSSRALDVAGRSAAWRRAFLAVLIYAGPRISEALDLRWRDVDLANGRLRIGGTKTDAANRTVELLPALRDELAAYAASRPRRDRDERVFTSARGGRISESNVRNRALASAIANANAALAKQDREPLPSNLTPHSLRRTFASVLVALGYDVAVVMRMMGHTTPSFTLSVYTQAMAWSPEERVALRALVLGEESSQPEMEPRGSISV